MTPTRPQAVRRQTAPPSCARPGRVRDPSPHEPVPTRTRPHTNPSPHEPRPTRTLKKEKRQGRSLPLTRTNVALLAAVDRLFQFGPGGEFCYFAGRNLDCGSGLRVAPVAGFSLRDGESAEADQRYPVSFF